MDQRQVRSSDIERIQLRWFNIWSECPLDVCLGSCFGHELGGDPRGRARTHWRDDISCLAWEQFDILFEELMEVTRESV